MKRSLLLCCTVLFCLPAAATSQAAEENPFNRIPWKLGPTTGTLGGEATIAVPAQCRFAGIEGTRQFLELTENPSSGDERGVLYCLSTTSAGTEYEWFAVFEFRADRYVSDDERDELKPEPILKNIREGTEASNKERRERGWEEMRVLGWQREPYYDTKTNNLTWAILGESGSSGQSINHSVRLLGRRGVMAADLVVNPEDYAAAVIEFDSAISSFAYLQGETYSEWKAGDQVAKYGLTALVAGGAGAVLAKTGLLQKFGKLLFVLVIGILASLKSMFAGLWRLITGKSQSTTSEQ